MVISNWKSLDKEFQLDTIGISTWKKIRNAVNKGNNDEALKLLDVLYIGTKRLHDHYVDWVNTLLTYISLEFGEEKVYDAFVHSFKSIWEARHERATKLDIRDYVQIRAETMREHFGGSDEEGDLKVVEDDEKFIIYLHPCGSGARSRIEKRPDTLFEAARTKKPYFWSWNKRGVSYYCVHCCIIFEIIPIQLYGYPLRIHRYNNDPTESCGFILYKDPEKIPSEYFTRVGMEKDVEKIKRHKELISS